MNPRQIRSDLNDLRRPTATAVMITPAGSIPSLAQRVLPTRLCVGKTATTLTAATLVAFLIGSLSVCAAAEESPTQLVRRGVRAYRGSDFDAALTAFKQAAKTRSEDNTIVFNQGCAEAALGRKELATESFRSAALDRDRKVSANSHYNLGAVVSAEAREIFGEKPEDAPPETRKKGTEKLLAAVAHFRACLKVAPDHAAARHNIEVIRLWLKHMADVWKRKDQEKTRAETDLLQFLEMIQKRQTEIGEQTRRHLSDPATTGPPTPLAVLGEGQEELIEELPTLKQKIRESAAQSDPSQPSAPNPQRDQAVAVLTGLVDESGRQMERAAGSLKNEQAEPARAQQDAALESLNLLYTAVVPFQKLLQDMIRKQDKTFGATKAISEQTQQQQARAATVPLTRTQTQLARWSEALAVKAQGQLDKVSHPAPADETDKLAPKIDAPPADPAASEPPEQQSAAPGSEQAAQLKAALEKAVELGPEIQQQTAEAAADLQEKSFAQATSKQSRALELLHEIEKLLPKQPQQQNQDNQDQQKKKQDKDQEKQEQDQGSNDNSDHKQSPQDRQKSANNDPGKEPDQAEQLSEQQAEALMRKVQQRQREYQALNKRLRQLIGRPAVSKDW